jgi:hypothetical protein
MGENSEKHQNVFMILDAVKDLKAEEASGKEVSRIFQSDRFMTI